MGEGQRAAEVRFTRFFHNTPVAIATLNRGGRVVQANASFSKLFGTLPRSGDPGEAESNFVPHVPSHRSSHAVASAGFCTKRCAMKPQITNPIAVTIMPPSTASLPEA